MTISLQIKTEQYRSAFHYLVICAYLAISIFGLRNYFIWDATSICGLLLLPLISRFNPAHLSLRFLPMAFLSGGLALYFPVKTCFFLAAMFALLFFLETTRGKINNTAILSLLVISPVFRILANTFGFPLRLWLSDLAAKIISVSGFNARAEGNIIIMNNDTFAVDQACAGLSMLGITYIICFFLVSLWENRSNKRTGIVEIAILLTLCSLFNLFGNLMRILILVLFKIMPDSIYHDLIGIVCLLVYIIIPIALLTKWIIKQNGKDASYSPKGYGDKHVPGFIHILLFLIVLYVSTHLSTMDKLNKTSPVVQLQGYNRKIMENNILKFENNKALIYYKPSTFYTPDHDPRICWQGSGYEFHYIKKTAILNCEVYTGVLSKGKDRIYSAWWFDSGKTRTINQLEWRWKALKRDEDFYLVNVNAQTKDDLQDLIKELLRQRR
ncbi:exosortase N [Arcticibacter tournemirensis]